MLKPNSRSRPRLPVTARPARRALSASRPARAARRARPARRARFALAAGGQLAGASVWHPQVQSHRNARMQSHRKVLARRQRPQAAHLSPPPR
jgi:hypothetical protein